jgi:glycosyltransferase involved in cell wall biosynthesis
MRVLIFTSQLHLLGGAERLAVELAEELNRRSGVQADVLCALPESFPGTEAAKQRLLRSGVRSVWFLGRAPGLGPRGFHAAMRQVRGILIEGGYDVVETCLMGPTSLGSWAVRGLGMPHVAGIHDVYRRAWKNGIRGRFYRWSCRTSPQTHFYGISRAASREWIRFARVQPERVRTIYNSIHASYFEARPDRERLAQELSLNSNSRLFLFVGRLTPHKGLRLIIEAVEPLLIDGATLLIAGQCQPNSGDAAFVEGLKRMTQMYGLSHAVRWLGRREDVPRLMASADVLLHPASLEGFGLVLAEALATGLPVVASNVDGIPEVVESTDSILVPPDNPMALREAINSVMSRTPLEAEACRRKGRARAEYFRTERRADDLLRYFRDLMAASSNV